MNTGKQLTINDLKKISGGLGGSKGVDPKVATIIPPTTQAKDEKPGL
ncbi:bacteriocin [Thalassomonas haliotis]|uniref:Bacteriocin n=1 Tax=Thalassomonas haliotis TaxID=485448 RepID=A0ABY7VDP9_9GAMM|nr:bacteriocin [Thalassomonas haliotis]WDE11007.1 bacteriocin [Thalassomonas haliotis]